MILYGTVILPYTATCTLPLIHAVKVPLSGIVSASGILSGFLADGRGKQFNPSLTLRRTCNDQNSKFQKASDMIGCCRGEELRRDSLEMGADAYIKKPVKPRTVIAHIRAALRRAGDWAEQEKSPEEENEKVYEPHPDFTVNEEAKAIYFLGILLDLTLFEYLILSNMIRHPGRIYSIDQITSMIDEDVVVTENSIYNMISRIRQKLAQIKPDITIIESCRGFGYRVVVPFNYSPPLPDKV